MGNPRRRFISLIGLCALIVLCPSAFAQSAFPTRFVTVIVPLSPGGGGDLTLAPFKDKVGAILGQPLVFTYKPGAAGAVGASFVAKAKPDGYTLLLGNKGGLITTPLTMKSAGYTMADLAPVCLLTKGPSIYYVRDGGPYKSLKDYIETAKKKPLSYATYGAFSLSHLSMLLVEKTSGFEVTHVPYAGATGSYVALLGGHVDMAIGTSQSNMVGPGKMRPVAQSSEKRWDLYPDVPTIKELGFPVKGDPFGATFSLWAPKGTPREAIDTIYRAFKRVVDENGQEIGKQMRNAELHLEFLGPDEFAEVANSEYAVIKKMLEDLGVQPQ